MKANLLLNGNPCSYPEQIENLESLVIFAAKKTQLSNEIVVDLKVNGKDLEEAYPHEAREIRLDDISSVEIFSQSVALFSSKFIEQAPELIEHLKSGFQLAIEMFRTGEKDEAAHDMLARCFDSLQSIRNVLSDIQRSGYGPESQVWKRFEVMANEICSAQVDLEPLRIADLLEDQMLPFLDDWKLAA